MWPQMWPQAKLNLVIIPSESVSHVTQVQFAKWATQARTKCAAYLDSHLKAPGSQDSKFQMKVDLDPVWVRPDHNLAFICHWYLATVLPRPGSKPPAWHEKGKGNSIQLVLRRGIVKHHLSLPESAWLRLLLDNSWGPNFHQSCFGMRRGEAVPCKYQPGLHNCLIQGVW